MRDKLAGGIKEGMPSLMYLRFMLNGRNLTPFCFNGKLIYNILNIPELRKNLYKLRDHEKISYFTLLGKYIREYDYDYEDDLLFSSNFESGNLCMAFKVS